MPMIDHDVEIMNIANQIWFENNIKNKENKNVYTNVDTDNLGTDNIDSNSGDNRIHNKYCNVEDALK